MASLSLVNVCKTYKNGFEAVKDVNLDIRDKEFLILVGPSGCGKSTTLRMIAGLEDISSGQLWIDGQLVNMLEPKNRDLSMVFQNYALFENMTVLKNVAYALRFHAAFRGKEAAMAKDILERVGMGDALDKYPAAGSSRERPLPGRWS